MARENDLEQLAERSNYLQTAYLLLDGFHHDAHPMGVLVGTVGAGGSER